MIWLWPCQRWHRDKHKPSSPIAHRSRTQRHLLWHRSTAGPQVRMHLQALHCQASVKVCFSNKCSGLTDLFEEASAVLKASEDVKQTAESLRKALALSSTYNKVKAWQAMAAHEAAQSELGIACADLQVLYVPPCCCCNSTSALIVLHTVSVFAHMVLAFAY